MADDIQNENITGEENDGGAEETTSSTETIALPSVLKNLGSLISSSTIVTAEYKVDSDGLLLDVDPTLSDDSNLSGLSNVVKLNFSTDERNQLSILSGGLFVNTENRANKISSVTIPAKGQHVDNSETIGKPNAIIKGANEYVAIFTTEATETAEASANIYVAPKGTTNFTLCASVQPIVTDIAFNLYTDDAANTSAIYYLLAQDKLYTTNNENLSTWTSCEISNFINDAKHIAVTQNNGDIYICGEKPYQLTTFVSSWVSTYMSTFISTYTVELTDQTNEDGTHPTEEKSEEVTQEMSVDIDTTVSTLTELSDLTTLPEYTEHPANIIKQVGEKLFAYSESEPVIYEYSYDTSAWSNVLKVDSEDATSLYGFAGITDLSGTYVAINSVDDVTKAKDYILSVYQEEQEVTEEYVDEETQETKTRTNTITVDISSWEVAPWTRTTVGYSSKVLNANGTLVVAAHDADDKTESLDTCTIYFTKDLETWDYLGFVNGKRFEAVDAINDGDIIIAIGNTGIVKFDKVYNEPTIVKDMTYANITYDKDSIIDKLNQIIEIVKQMNAQN